MAMPQEPPPGSQRELIPLDSLAKRFCPPGGDARRPQLEALAVDPEEDVAQIARADPARSFPHPCSQDDPITLANHVAYYPGNA